MDSLLVTRILPSDWECDKGRPRNNQSCQRSQLLQNLESKDFACTSFQVFYTRSGNKSGNSLRYTDLIPKAWSFPDYQTSLLILRDLSHLPVAMESEGCSQWIVHGWSRIQVGCRKETQQEDTDSSLTCPVQRCSLGTACKKKYFSVQSSCSKCCNLKNRYLILISTTQLCVFSDLITKLSSKQNLDAFDLLL